MNTDEAEARALRATVTTSRCSRSAPRLLGLLAALCCCVLVAACDDDAPPPVAPTTAARVDPILELDLKPIIPLLPSRATHATIDPLGNIYYVQENDRRDDAVFVIGEGEVPRATQLSAGNVAAALGATGGRGNIHDIAAGPAGEIYFYFAGSQGRSTLAAIGQYHPRTAKIRILADTDGVAAATNMGRSLPLARGTIFADGRYVWAWLRHTDAWALFKIDTTKLPADGHVQLPPAFKQVTLDGRPVELTREEYRLSPAPEQSMFLLDTAAGRLLKIGPDGSATLVRSLVGLPQALSTPALDRDGKLLLFAGNGAVIGPADVQQAQDAAPIELSYPAMLLFDGDHRTAIERDRIMAYPGFRTYSMQLEQLIPHPKEQAWISYDAASGELLRIKIRERLWP